MNNKISISCPHCLTTNRVPVGRDKDNPNCGKCHKPLFIGEPIQLNDHWLNTFLEQNESLLLVDFWAPWCGPCLQMEPEFAAAAKRLEPKVRLGRINTEQNELVAGRYNIRSIPTIILFAKNHGEVARHSGVLASNSIVDWVQRHVEVSC